MPFIIVFNIVVSVLFGLVLITVFGCSIASRDCAKRNTQESLKTQQIIDKIKFIAYIVFFAVTILMILINIIV